MRLCFQQLIHTQGSLKNQKFSSWSQEKYWFLFLKFLLMDIFYKQSWKTWLQVLKNYSSGPFMDVVNFIIKTATMIHRDYWRIIELWSDKRLYKDVRFCKVMYLETLANAWIVPGLDLKLLWWNHLPILDIFISSFSTISSTFWP